MQITESTKRNLRRRLLAWYVCHRRDLPWRYTRDPYKIWISEVMLQQTRAEAVIPYYHRWLKEFPDLECLARARSQKVLKAWEGLGYYQRARNLHAAAQEICRRHEGRIPNQFAELCQLPGIGRYTAGAIASIAFGESIPALDGNAARVLSRLFAIRRPIHLSTTQRLLWELADVLLPRRPDPGSGQQTSVGDFNQALMELGATVCLPRGPRCGRCPVRLLCLARKKKLQDRLPIRTRNKRMVSMVRLAAVVQHAGRVFLTRRPPGGRLADFWQLPGIEWVDKAGKTNRNGSVAHASRLRLALEKKYCLRTGVLRWRCRWDYTITKYAMRLEVFDTELAGDLILTDSTAKQADSPRQSSRWFFPRDLKKLPLPSADRRVIEEPV